MKVLLTGANGFLGRSVYQSYVSNGHEVLPLVRTSSGFPRQIVFDLKSGEFAELEQVIIDCDCIVHLGAVVNFTDKFDEEMYQINYCATLKLAEIAEKFNKHFIFSSSASISKSMEGKVSISSEDYPDTPYALSKYIAERAVELLHSNYCILRIGGIYGFTGPEHLYLNKAIRQALTEGVTPTILPASESKRNYIYVKDLADWIVKISESKTRGKYVIGGGEVLTVREILSLVAREFLNINMTITPARESEFSDFIIEEAEAPIKLRSYQQAYRDILTDFKNKQ